MASPWPKTVLVTVGTPVDLFAQDGVDDTINTLVVQNLSQQPIRMGDREAAPVKTEVGFKLVTDATVHAIRSEVATDKTWLWVASSASRIVYAPYVEIRS